MATQYLDSAICSKESVFCFSQSVLLLFHRKLPCYSDTRSERECCGSFSNEMSDDDPRIWGSVFW